MKTINKFIHIIIVLSLLMIYIPPKPAHAAGTILYAHGNYFDPYTLIIPDYAVYGGGTGDCSSWANACPLEDALDDAEPGDEIWLLRGSYDAIYTSNWVDDVPPWVWEALEIMAAFAYSPQTKGAPALMKPVEPAPQAKSGHDFCKKTWELTNGVAIYGGFAGTETSFSQRDWINNQTILSFGTACEDDHHTVVSSNADANTILEGVIIEGGKAEGDLWNADSVGGGMLILNGSPTLSNIIFRNNAATVGGGLAIITEDDVTTTSKPVLMNVTFQSNKAQYGGGLFTYQSEPVLIGVSFLNNLAYNWGGGMATKSTVGHPVLNAVTFAGNTAWTGGGGLYNENSDPALYGVTFNGNLSIKGGAMANAADSHPLIYSSLFIDQFNYSVAGENSVIYNLGGGYPLIIDRATFSNNQQAIMNDGFSGEITNSIIWGNSGTFTEANIIKDSIVQGGCPTGGTCTNVMNTDPMFGPLGDYGENWDNFYGTITSLPLLPGSPAIDAGAGHSLCYNQDQRGIDIQLEHCDLGAFESRGFVLERQGDINSWKQMTTPGSIFPRYIFDRVTSPYNEPVNGGVVTLEGPSSGASTAPATQDLSIADGSIGSMIYANMETGLYTLDVTTTGVQYPIHYYLSNGEGLLYVKPDGVSTNDCFSWATACDMQTALENGDDYPIDEIWVAAGTYKPSKDKYDLSSGSAREYTFKLREGVGLYGGFAGDEIDRSQRDLVANPTILSGDLGVTGNNSDNVYHVVTGEDNAILDGFTVTAGNANGTGLTAGGGGMLNYFTSPDIENVTFSGNSATTAGGGVYNESTSANIIGVTFDNNTASNGGGMFNHNTTLTFKNITFSNNHATTTGGGAMANYASSITLNNATLSENTSDGPGGGLYITGGDTTIHNSIIWNNSGDGGFNDIYFGSSTISVSNSVMEDGFPGVGNTTADPLLGTYDYHGGYAKTYSLLFGSPAINTGDNAYCPEADQRAVPRPQPAGGICDMGAYEYVDAGIPVVTAFTATSPSGLAIPIISFTATDDIGVNGYLITESATVPTESAQGWTSIIPTHYTVSSDGVYTLYPWAKDATGNVSAVYTAQTVVVETIPPTVDTFTIDSPVSTNLTVPITAFTASDVGSSVAGYLVALTSFVPDAGDAGWSGSAPSSYTFTSDGEYTLYPWAKDEAGNVSTEFATPPTVLVDTTRPTIEITTTASDPTNISPIPITITFDEIVTGFAVDDIVVGNGVASNFSGTDDIYTVDITPAADGPVTIDIDEDKALDEVGFGNVAATQFTITYDDSAPNITSISRWIPANNPTSADTLQFQVTFNEAVQDVDFTDFSVEGTTTAVVTDIVPDTASIYLVTVEGGDLVDFNGSIGLNLSSTQDITNMAGIALTGNEPTIDETYQVDNAAITVLNGGITGFPNSLSIANGGIYPAHFKSIEVSFDNDAANPLGNTDTDDVTNPNNYLLLQSGVNKIYDTLDCAAFADNGYKPLGDDIQIPTGPVTYNNNNSFGPFISKVTINNNNPMKNGEYKLFVCGTTSITDLSGNHLGDGLTDQTTIFHLIDPPLPNTGFAPGSITNLPKQPDSKGYTSTEMTLEIPKLGFNLAITNVPQSEEGWDVTWLGNSVGYLDGSAYPTWEGNTILTGHVWDANNVPGPFVDIKTLQYGDQIMIHAWDKVYTYEVRESKLVSSDSTQSVLKHEVLDWVTLITCEDYHFLWNSYSGRRVIRAVLINIK